MAFGTLVGSVERQGRNVAPLAQMISKFAQPISEFGLVQLAQHGKNSRVQEFSGWSVVLRAHGPPEDLLINKEHIENERLISAIGEAPMLPLKTLSLRLNVFGCGIAGIGQIRASCCKPFLSLL